MVTEIAQIEIKPGTVEQFEAGVRQAAPLFRAAQGCSSVRLWKSVEEPLRYRLLVDWDTVEDHTVTFRQSDAFAQWRALVSEYFSEPPKVEHQAGIDLQ